MFFQLYAAMSPIDAAKQVRDLTSKQFEQIASLKTQVFNQKLDVFQKFIHQLVGADKSPDVRNQVVWKKLKIAIQSIVDEFEAGTSLLRLQSMQVIDAPEAYAQYYQMALLAYVLWQKDAYNVAYCNDFFPIQLLQKLRTAVNADFLKSVWGVAQKALNDEDFACIHSTMFVQPRLLKPFIDQVIVSLVDGRRQISNPFLGDEFLCSFHEDCLMRCVITQEIPDPMDAVAFCSVTSPLQVFRSRELSVEQLATIKARFPDVVRSWDAFKSDPRLLGPFVMEENARGINATVVRFGQFIAKIKQESEEFFRAVRMSREEMQREERERLTAAAAAACEAEPEGDDEGAMLVAEGDAPPVERPMDVAAEVEGGAAEDEVEEFALSPSVLHRQHQLQKQRTLASASAAAAEKLPEDMMRKIERIRELGSTIRTMEDKDILQFFHDIFGDSSVEQKDHVIKLRIPTLRDPASSKYVFDTPLSRALVLTTHRTHGKDVVKHAWRRDILEKLREAGWLE